MQGLDDFSFGDISRINEKRVTININGQFEGGKVLYIQSDWTLDSFLRKSAERLDVSGGATRCFNSDGIEISDMMMVTDGDILFLSRGDDYLPPGFTGEDSMEDSDRGDIPKVIGGWKVTMFLGRGGFGEVRVGEHQLSGERVALKFMKKAGIADISAVERTNTEVQCLLALKHPHIITLLQHLVTPSYIVLAFELMEGGDLYDHLASLPVSALSEEEAREIFIQVLGAVGHAHNNHICHRDLKLENILIVDKEPPDGNLQVKIADFGLSDFYRPGAHVRTHCGSLSYLAPEVFRGTSNAGPPLDVWSMGVILFALLCGRLPFEGSDLRGNNRPKESAIRKRVTQCQYKIDEALSPEARDLIRRMLKLDPTERASVPEIFGHCWLRSRGFTAIDVPAMRSDSTGRRRVEVDHQESGESAEITSAGLSTERTVGPSSVERKCSDENSEAFESFTSGEDNSERQTALKNIEPRNSHRVRAQGSARLEEGKTPSPTRLVRRAATNVEHHQEPRDSMQKQHPLPTRARGGPPQHTSSLNSSPDPNRRRKKEAGFMRSTASSGNRRAMNNLPLKDSSHGMKVLGSASESNTAWEEREKEEELHSRHGYSRQRRRDLSDTSKDSCRSHKSSSSSPQRRYQSSASPRNSASKLKSASVELPAEDSARNGPHSNDPESSRNIDGRRRKHLQEKHSRDSKRNSKKDNAEDFKSVNSSGDGGYQRNLATIPGSPMNERDVC